MKPTTEVEATSILPSLNVKTARSWRAIVSFTHLAPEGRMTVTIGRRELLVALGGVAAAWPRAARAQQPAMPVIGFLRSASLADATHLVAAFRQGLKDSYWLDMDDRTLVMVMVTGIGANLTNEEKRAHLIDLRREHLIDKICIQEILPPER